MVSAFAHHCYHLPPCSSPTHASVQGLNDTVGRNIVSDFIAFNWQWVSGLAKALGWGQLTTNVLFVSMPHLITPCHYDEQENLFAQVCTALCLASFVCVCACVRACVRVCVCVNEYSASIMQPLLQSTDSRDQACHPVPARELPVPLSIPVCYLKLVFPVPRGWLAHTNRKANLCCQLNSASSATHLYPVHVCVGMFACVHVCVCVDSFGHPCDRQSQVCFDVQGKSLGREREREYTALKK